MKEALKLALEAIEHLSHNARKAGVEMGLAFVVADEAITAIKEALMSVPDGAEPTVSETHKQEPCEQEAPHIGHDCAPYLPDTMKVFCPACGTKFQAVSSNLQKLLIDAGFEPPFTSPLQRTWVNATTWRGLTDEEIQKMRHLIDWTAGWSYNTFARAVEAKLKEKNGYA